jgi:hypothetical protein
MPLPRHSQALPPLVPDDLRRYLTKAKGVAGPCGWTHAELRALPDELYHQLIAIFHLMEYHGTALEVNCHGDVTLIPKKTGEVAVDQLRPITVLSYFHRLYAGARLRSGLFQWQEEVLKNIPLRACRPGAATHDLTLAAAATLELHAHEGAETQAVSYDLAKAFDSMPFPAGELDGIGWLLMQRLGFDQRVLAVMFNQYDRMQRRFKTLQHLGAPVPAAGLRGIIQGCAISMVFCNCITVLWHELQRMGTDLPPAVATNIVEHEAWPSNHVEVDDLAAVATPDARTTLGGFADDLHALTDDAAAITRVHLITMIWAIACDMQVNSKKSNVFGTAQLYVGRKRLTQTKQMTLLGNRLCSDGRVLKADPARIAEVRRRLERVGRLPGSKQDREYFISADVMPVLYGHETVTYTARDITAMRYASWQAIRGGNPPSHVMSIEVVLTHTVRGHRVDPVQYAVTTLVRTWVQFLSKSHLPAIEHMLGTVHAKLASRLTLTRVGCGGMVIPRVEEAPDSVFGPLAMLWEVLHSLGWSWPQLRTFQAGDVAYNFPLSTSAAHEFHHRLRQAVRERELKDTQHVERRGGLPRRRDLAGVDTQLQWDANVRLIRQLAPQEAGVLQCVLSGGLMTRERASKHAKRPDLPPKCIMPGCDCDIETTEHRLWHCQAHEQLRSTAFKQLRTQLAALQPCEVNCGLATTSFPKEFNISEIQRVMLAVELHARSELDRLRHGYTGDDEEDERSFYAASTGTSGMHGARRNQERAAKGQQVKRTTYQPPPGNTHPPDRLSFTADDSRVTCLRCTRTAQRSHSTNWSSFWSAECHDVESAGMSLRAIAVGSGRRERDRAGERAMFASLAQDHQVPADQLAWSEHPQAPVTCLRCSLAWPFMVARRDRLKGCGASLIFPCTGDQAEGRRAAERVQAFQPHSSHDIVETRDRRMKICKACGFYMTDTPPPRTPAYAMRSPCRGNFSRPWEGVTYHEDPKWYQPHL